MNARTPYKQTTVSMCIAVGLAVSILFCSSPAHAAPTEAEKVTAVVTTFYKNYITPPSQKLEDYDFRKQPEVDVSFIEKIETLIKEAEGVLGYDAILMAQDIPGSQEFEQPVIKGTSAEVIFYNVWGEDTKTMNCVTLIQRGSDWRITDVIDMDFADTTFACGGKKGKGK